jgi:3-dehydroquinate dehydratase II
MALSVLVLHGPNLSLLAEDEIDPRLEARADELSVELITVQSNGEQGLLDALHEHAEDVDAVLVNPGALASYAWALAEGLQQSALPAIEVLLKALDPARGPSSLTGVVKQQLHGLGIDGYVRALELLVPAVAAPPAVEDEQEEEVEAPVLRKSLGRGAKPAPAAVARGGKSIGRKLAAAAAATSPASRGKTIGRGAPKEAAPARSVGGLTRAQVRERIAQRLKGKTSAEALASWARETWTGLQKGAAVEVGAKDTIENVLLTLMAGAKASDAMLVAQMAKLES